MKRVFLIGCCLSVAMVGCDEPHQNSVAEVTVEESLTPTSEPNDLTSQLKYPTPADALRAIYKAIDTNDMKTAKEVSLFLTEEYQEAFFNATMAPSLAMKRYNRAALRVFGESAELLPSTGGEFMEKIESIPVEFTSDKVAIWKHQDKEQLKVIRMEQGWIVDMRSMEEEFPDPAVFESMHNTANRFLITAERIENGELKTMDEVRNQIGRL